MERWKEVANFPGYSISSKGRVRNDSTDRLLALSVNQRQFLYVGLMRGGLQYKRSISVLVAHAFLEKPALKTFDTPIHLDGDKLNVDISNLVWRPHWFAVKYHRQFKEPNSGYLVPVKDVQSGEVFDTSWDAAVKYGLLNNQIRDAIVNQTTVWPTGQMFILSLKGVVYRK